MSFVILTVHFSYSIESEVNIVKLPLKNLKTKLEAQGPFIAHLITNSKQFSQKKDNQNDRIQINACVDSVFGNTSV